MSADRPRPAPPCPACGRVMQRARREDADRQLYGGRNLRRYQCAGLDCGWTGLLPPRPEPGAAARLWAWSPRVGRGLGLAVLGLLIASAGATWLQRGRSAPPAMMVGPHVVLPGTHLEGDRLPAPHPLREALPVLAQDDEPESYSEAPQALLRARRHCAWGLPGRNPYRGSVEQALQTAKLSPHVVRQIAHQVRTGQRVDRVVISKTGIRADQSGRRFDPRRIAMTYGMTMCLDTHVNFAGGHIERGDLYEAMDEDGRMYAVMVPDVCGNVSVLGQAGELAFDPPGHGRAPGAQTPLSEVLKLPPERRPRELPETLRYTDDLPPGGGGGGGGGVLPLPGSLPLVGLGLALALWARRRR